MEIDNYPTLVDAIWENIQGEPEDRERVDFYFSEQQIAERFGITYEWSSNACVFGIAQALNDLVDMGYCKGIGSFNGQRWRIVAPSADCPEMPPTASSITLPLSKLLPLRRKALQFIHEQSVQHKENITFYTLQTILDQDAISALLPTTDEVEQYSALGQITQALSGLKNMGFVRGSISSGSFTLQPTFKGACWLLRMQPLLKPTTANLICRGALPARRDRSADHGGSGVGYDDPRDDSRVSGAVPAKQ